MSDTNHDWRSYHVTLDPVPNPKIEVGTPIYGETTDGEPLTLYVTEVTEDGVIRIGADKPED